MEITYHIHDIEAIANTVLKALTSKTIVLNGEMGVGKTTFIKALVKVLGSTDKVSSPTFSIVNEYKTPNKRIYHFDLYRIENEEEALNFGFEEYVYANDWVLIEWPEKVARLLPKNVNSISMVLNTDATRTLKLSQNLKLTEKNAMEQQKI